MCMYVFLGLSLWYWITNACALSISLALSVPWPSVVLCPWLQASPLKVLSVSGNSTTSRGGAVKITNKHPNMNL